MHAHTAGAPYLAGKGGRVQLRDLAGVARKLARRAGGGAGAVAGRGGAGGLGGGEIREDDGEVHVSLPRIQGRWGGGEGLPGRESRVGEGGEGGEGVSVDGTGERERGGAGGGVAPYLLFLTEEGLETAFLARVSLRFQIRVYIHMYACAYL